MKLLSSTGDELELTIQGYQYPDAAEPQKRYSWHMIAGSARTTDEAWAFRYPALTCDESPRIAQWLRRTAESLGGPVRTAPPALSFTEPNLVFTVLENIGETISLTVTLDLEFRSPSRRQVREAFTTPNTLHLQITPAALCAAANDWDADVQQYPDGLAGTVRIFQ